MTFQEWWKDNWGGTRGCTSIVEFEVARDAWYAGAKAYQRPNDWIESEEFNGVCYSYRAWPITDPAGVVARFEELKEYIKSRT